jgi:ribosomal-protein-alanine N-acetyltransferase
VAASSFLFETQRLGFREFSPNDSSDLYRLNSDSEVIRYTGDSPFASEQEAHNFVLGYDKYRIDGFGRWAVINKSNQEFLGWSGLNRIGAEIDLGYRFFRSAWGQGFATEAAQACLDYGFRRLGLSRIIARALPENIGSWRVLEKVGMKFTGFGNCKGLEGARLYEITQPTATRSPDPIEK